MTEKERLDMLMEKATSAPWYSEHNSDESVVFADSTDISFDTSSDDADLIVAIVNAYASGDLITREQHDAVERERNWLAETIGEEHLTPNWDYIGIAPCEDDKTNPWLYAAAEATKEPQCPPQ